MEFPLIDKDQQLKCVQHKLNRCHILVDTLLLELKRKEREVNQLTMQLYQAREHSISIVRRYWPSTQSQNEEEQQEQESEDTASAMDEEEDYDEQESEGSIDLPVPIPAAHGHQQPAINVPVNLAATAALASNEFLDLINTAYPQWVRLICFFSL